MLLALDLYVFRTLRLEMSERFTGSHDIGQGVCTAPANDEGENEPTSSFRLEQSSQAQLEKNEPYATLGFEEEDGHQGTLVPTRVSPHVDVEGRERLQVPETVSP